MRDHRAHQLRKAAHRGAHRSLARFGLADGVGELIKLCDGFVEGKAFDAVRHLVNRTVHGAGKVFFAFAGLIRHRRDTLAQPGYAVEVFVGRLGAARCPFHIAFGWAVRHYKPPRRIRAIGRDDVHRIDDVLFGFRHLDDRANLYRGAVGQLRAAFTFGHGFRQVPDRAAIGGARGVGFMRHHALREQRVERLDRLGRQMTGLVHRAGKEAAVEQMQNRMLNAADILIDVHPVVGVFKVGRRGGVRRGKAHVIPRRIDKRIHRVGFAPRRRPAFRAGAVAPRRVAVKRVAGNVKADIIGQLDRQVFLGFRHHAAGRAVDHRNRAAPIALA